jgi:hypothetical protein
MNETTPKSKQGRSGGFKATLVKNNVWEGMGGVWEGWFFTRQIPKASSKVHFNKTATASSHDHAILIFSSLPPIVTAIFSMQHAFGPARLYRSSAFQSLRRPFVSHLGRLLVIRSSAFVPKTDKTIMRNRKEEESILKKMRTLLMKVLCQCRLPGNIPPHTWP